MAESKTPWIVMGGKHGETAHCKRCGQGMTMGTSQPIYMFLAMTEAFIKQHKKCKEGTYTEPKTESVHEWFHGRDTGTSSLTIYSVMMHTASPHGQYDAPHDSDDFGRCYRLLKIRPEWRLELHRVAKKYPIWGPMANRWDELTALYEEELPAKTAPKLYALMQELYDAGRVADGWVKTGPGNWSKPR